MDVYSRVRRACFKDGMSVRVAALYFSKDPKTVAMMLGHELPPSYRSYEIRRRATLDTFVGFIDLIVHTYIALIKTQRHTAKRKFKITLRKSPLHASLGTEHACRAAGSQSCNHTNCLMISLVGQRG
jgi:hypothetical protein